MSTHELATTLGVSIQNVWNWTLRGRFEAEPPEIYRQVSNRRMYLPCLILPVLDPQTTPRTWCARRLVEFHMLSQDQDQDTAQVLAAIECLERGNLLKRRWQVRLPQYLDRVQVLVKGSEITEKFSGTNQRSYPVLCDTLGNKSWYPSQVDG